MRFPSNYLARYSKLCDIGIVVSVFVMVLSFVFVLVMSSFFVTAY